MRDETSLRRQLLLLMALSSRRYGLTVSQMAADAGVTQKTIRRDLNTFRSVGVPLEETVGDFGRKTWQIKGGGHQSPLSFTFEEAAAMEIARRRLEPLAGTPFHESASEAFRKIRATLPERVLAYLDNFTQFFHQTAIGLADYAHKGDLVTSLLVALEECKAVHLLYQSDQATEPASRDVYPLGLIPHKEWIYLIGFDPQEDKIKHYKLDRIEAVELSNFPFRRPEGFSLAAHLASTFGIYHSERAPVAIKVRFARSVARYVQESKRHPSQTLTKQHDGSILAEFTLSSTEEFCRWIYSFGAKAVVLEPESLRQEIVEELEALFAAYVSSDTVSSERSAAGEDSKPLSRYRPV